MRTASRSATTRTVTRAADAETRDAATRTAAPTRTGRGRPNRRAPQRSPRRPPERAPRRAAEPGRSTAAQKAYARRAQRTAAVDHVESGTAAAGLGSLPRLRLPKSRASFVMLMMSLLATGVVLTLWLSTQAIADSYRLERMRAETAQLAERAEQLQREVARQESPTTLAQRAEQLGMVPSGNPARIVVTGKGKPRLVGQSHPAGG